MLTQQDIYLVSGAGTDTANGLYRYTGTYNGAYGYQNSLCTLEWNDSEWMLFNGGYCLYKHPTAPQQGPITGQYVIFLTGLSPAPLVTQLVALPGQSGLWAGILPIFGSSATCTISWGDGQQDAAGTSGVEMGHRYKVAGTYTVTATFTDVHSVQASLTLTVTVHRRHRDGRD